MQAPASRFVLRTVGVNKRPHRMSLLQNTYYDAYDHPSATHGQWYSRRRPGACLSQCMITSACGIRSKLKTHHQECVASKLSGHFLRYNVQCLLHQSGNEWSWSFACGQYATTSTRQQRRGHAHAWATGGAVTSSVLLWLGGCDRVDDNDAYCMYPHPLPTHDRQYSRQRRPWNL